ncbi:hypothetical protein LTR37_016621 [Vermiconidia calcicola]|uniref:Uncharacterized protein n=1 Tax=Vermiconidia calcicola TaxID=1690605 RepID=A0ACC3MML3_9PEZI|nr:hypothetical protein LTR37_016621 [Vermiconidia calcicola]
MLSTITPIAALAALVALPAVSAHGYVSGVVAGGKYYGQSGPNWIYGEKPQQASWYANNPDLGFVGSADYNKASIICHIDATPGTTSIPVKAGSAIDLQWTTWPDSHHGPVISYLARCGGGDCSKVNPGSLKFFKIAESGLIDGSAAPGKYASDVLIANNGTSTVTIPASVTGDFVLRHEIIALHSAGESGGAQSYPMCINLKVSGGGNAHPCKSGADCRAGAALMKTSDPGVLVNIYQTLTSYKIPGPKIWSGLKKRSFARSFNA